MTTRTGIFVTGGHGFVGRRLLIALHGEGRPVIALDRSGVISNESWSGGGLTVLRGDLLDPDSYRAGLQTCDVVLHLAAVTGRAPAEEHMRVNARGTELLLDACRAAGVPKIVFVSSIATTFSDQTGYAYAQSKTAAEQAVSRSGLRYLTLRPTIIFGAGSPVQTALEKLALLPIIPMPGNGRARVQPIHVDDVVACIIAIVRGDRFANDVCEVGGPDVVTMAELLLRLRRAHTSRSAPVVHIPVGLLRAPLRLAEAIGLGRMLPMSAGQLSSFQCDGVARRSWLDESYGAGFVPLSQMVSRADGAAPAASVVPGGPAVKDALDAECRVFTRHLLGCDPDDHVTAKYRDAQALVPSLSSESRFDHTLIAFARMSPLCTKVADAYASVFAPASVLRKRLVLLLAILETRAPFHQRVDRTIDGSMPFMWMALVMKVCGAVVSLLAGVVVLLPIRMIMALVTRPSR